MKFGFAGCLLDRQTRFDKVMVSFMAAFDVLSIFYSIRLRNALYMLSALASLALLFVPCLFEYFFSLRISKDLKMAYWFVVLGGPVLGNIYKFYHYIRPWDKLLHMMSGFLASALGYALCGFLFKEPPDKWVRCLFAVCFSLAIGALWEIYEYLLDVFFRMDMQNDTVITSISSYLLGDTPGTIGEIESISSVSINGELLEKGYIDIGLIDTMRDMIQCLIGAVFCALTAAFQKPGSRFAMIWPV